MEHADDERVIARTAHGIRRLFSHGATAALRIGLRAGSRQTSGVAHLGTPYGGWKVPMHEIDSSWVCYTAGIGEDASFDLALSDIGCDVVAIDPTPRAIDYMRPLVAERENLRLAPYALWTDDSEVEFFPPAESSHVSFSVTNRQHTSRPLRVPARTLTSIAAEFGHDQIDLLKLDVEGAEYPVLQNLDLRALGVQVLCVEYHGDHGFRGIWRAARSILKRGYRAVAVDGTDVTFVRDDGSALAGDAE